MKKTKLGISAALFVAALYFLGLYGGYVVTGLLVAYVLFVEEDSWLKKQALSVLGLMIVFSLAGTALNLIPNLFSLIYSVLEIMEVHVYVSLVHRIFNVLGSALSLIKTIVFVLFGACALIGKPVKISALDALLDKYMN